MTSNQDLQGILEAHGQEFIKSFSSIRERRPASNISSTLRNVKQRISVSENESLEEWTGFSSADTQDMLDSDSDRSSKSEEIQSGRKPEVIVFNEALSQNQKQSTRYSRAFMSSKVSKLTQNAPHQNLAQGDNVGEDEGEDDVTNARNDVLLHQLVHTQLLSGSLRQELNLSHAQRQKALEGRILELTASSKLGRGETEVRASEKNKAAKHIRDGIKAKRKEREKEALEEAKNLGNYHPALKKLFATPDSVQPRKRDRGLKMGVGRFSDGILRVSKDEIKKGNGDNSRRFGLKRIEKKRKR